MITRSPRINLIGVSRQCNEVTTDNDQPYDCICIHLPRAMNSNTIKDEMRYFLSNFLRQARAVSSSFNIFLYYCIRETHS